MTVSAQTPRSGPYSGNGSTTAFGYGFLVEADTEIVVTVADALGAETVKTLTTDYTVSAVGTPAGGVVTFVTAPVSTEEVVITRTIAMTQAVDLQNRKSVVPQVLEDAYDKLTRITQDHKEQLGRSIKVDLFGATDMAALTTNVNIVAGISSDVAAVSAISTDVTTVADNIAAVQGADAAATAAGDSETAAAASLASFEQLYLGSKAVEPTLDNEGNALITGAQYFNSVSDLPFIWNGSAWTQAVFDIAGAALNSENLSGLANAGTARNNLGLGTAALAATGDFATAGTIGLVFIESQDASSTANLDFTGFDAALYDSYVFKFANLIPNGDAAEFRLYTSSNGGSTYDNSAGNYAYADTTGVLQSALYFLLTSQIGNAAGEDGVSGSLDIFGPHLAKKTIMSGNLSSFNTIGEFKFTLRAGVRLSSGIVDAVRFTYSTGQFVSGTISMYGMRNS